jgi:hypothetical protein
MSALQIRVGADQLELHTGRTVRRVCRQLLRARHGYLALAPSDLVYNDLDHLEVIGRLHVNNGRPWASAPAATDDVPVRAAIWALLLRVLLQDAAVGADEAMQAQLQVDQPEDGAAILDVCRACALVGLDAVSVNDQPLLPQVEIVRRWRARRPWAALAVAGTVPGVAIRRDTPLPAKVRVGRRFVAPDTPAESLSIQLSVGEDRFDIALHDLDEFAGTQELEICWHADGALTVDLVIDGQWRPLPPSTAGEWQSDSGRQAAGEYAALSGCHAWLACVPVQLLPSPGT